MCQKKGVTLTFSVTAANCEEFFLQHHRSHLTSERCNRWHHFDNTGVGPTFAPTPIIAWLARPSVRPSARWQPRKVSKSPKKTKTQPNSIGRSLQTIHWQQTLCRSFSAGWRLLTRWPLIRSIIRLWWRLGMWGMSVRFSHLPDYPAPTLDSLPLVLSPAPALPLTPSHLIIYSLELVCLHFLDENVSIYLKPYLVDQRWGEGDLKTKKVTSATFQSLVWCTQSGVSLHY